MRYESRVWRLSTGPEWLKRLRTYSSAEPYRARTDSGAAAKMASTPAREFSSAHARALAIPLVSPLILAHSNVCTVAEGTWKPMLLHSSRRISFPDSGAEVSVGVRGSAVPGLLAARADLVSRVLAAASCPRKRA